LSLKPGSSLSVLFYLSGDSNKASSRVRGFWIAEGLEQLNVRCTLRWKDTKKDLAVFAYEMLHHDAIIFQKTYSRYHRWSMALARLMGKQTYLDLDDAPSKTQSIRTLKNVESMMRMADGVFVGNQNLLDYVKQHQSNVHLIASGINLSHYPLRAKVSDSAVVCLGWIGNGALYKQDLIKILAEPLAQLASRFPLRFKLVGACGVQELYDTFGAIPNLEIDFIDEIKWSDPHEVSRSIQDFDIGLYPLLPNDFNQFKCGFKALEYMATGIPVVSSPIAINAEIVCDEINGLFADSETEWFTAISQLIEHSDKRCAMGREGRRTVEDSFDVLKIAAQIKSIMGSRGRTTQI